MGGRPLECYMKYTPAHEKAQKNQEYTNRDYFIHDALN